MEQPHLGTGVRAPLDLEGGGDLIARKKITQCPKACVVQMQSNRSKNKNVHSSYVYNERIIIPKLQLSPDFSNLQDKRKLVRKIGCFEKFGVTKITVFD